MANIATTFRNPVTIAARKLDVPNADFDGGTNNSTSSSVGIATDNPDLDESLPNWTLEDQFEVARTPQVSQYIGGNGLGAGVSGNGAAETEYIIGLTNPVYPNATGLITPTGDASLVSLAAGWVIV